MSRKGLKALVWTGWLTGIIFLKKPWGKPFVVSWISFNTLWALILLSVNIITNVDAIRHSDVFDSVVSGNSLIHYINRALVIGLNVRNFTIRIILIVYAKALAKLLNRIYTYQIKKETLTDWSTAWTKVYILYMLFILEVIGNSGINNWMYAERLFPVSDLKSLGFVPFWILGLFAFILQQLPIVVAFFLTTSVIFQLGMIFGDFCESLSVELNSSLKLFTITNKTKQMPLRTKEEAVIKQLFLHKFDEIVDLFKKADEIVSPMALIVISSAVFQTIPSVYGAFTSESTGKDSFLVKASCIVLFIEQITLLTLVFIGQYVYNKIEEAKGGLRKVKIFIPQGDGVKMEFDTGDVATLAINFNWNLSACQFFTIDLRLLAGIMATAMSYIVILVQLQFTFTNP